MSLDVTSCLVFPMRSRAERAPVLGSFRSPHSRPQALCCCMKTCVPGGPGAHAGSPSWPSPGLTELSAPEVLPTGPGDLLRLCTFKTAKDTWASPCLSYPSLPSAALCTQPRVSPISWGSLLASRAVAGKLAPPQPLCGPEQMNLRGWWQGVKSHGGSLAAQPCSWTPTRPSYSQDPTRDVPLKCGERRCVSQSGTSYGAGSTGETLLRHATCLALTLWGLPSSLP